MKIKVCGMKNAANMAAICQLDPDYMGFIFYPASTRFVGDFGPELIPALDSLTNIVRTGVFVDESPDVILRLVKLWHLDAVQLHGAESPEICGELQNVGLEVIKAFGVDDGFEFNQLDKFEPFCDYFLFDTKTKQHGGSGRAFNWKVLANYRLSKPYFLSGGLGPENINDVQGLHDERLYAVDLNSKFEISPGIKDVKSLKQAFKQLKQQDL